jgi:ferredoxin-NADP reductase
MADWVNGKVTQVKQWTDGLFSIIVDAPIDPFIAGQFAKLALEVDGNACSAPILTSTPPAIRIWSFTWLPCRKAN